MPLPSFFERLGQSLVQALQAQQRPRAGHAFRCTCGAAIFFPNNRCLACGAELGFDSRRGELLTLSPASAPGLWLGASPEWRSRSAYRRCANAHTAAACNWLVPAEDPAPDCPACRLNRTIPDLSVAENAVLWSRVENAKRRVVAQLLAHGLPVRARQEDPARGLAFDFLRPVPGGPAIVTGHQNGLITLNVEEADDARREQIRANLGEPYRTVVGHLRHELGHYYWDRLVAPGWRLTDFRNRFGDERTHYGSALARHYQFGPPADWPSRFVSAYAASHPWEDWAETWAQYLHMTDTLHTALSFGLTAEDVEMPCTPFGPEALHQPNHPSAQVFLHFINSWMELSAVLNELCRCMGQPDLNPFALSAPAVAKLHLVHLVVAEAGQVY